MNAYVKGAIAVFIAAAALFSWYLWKEPSLPVNQSPAEFQLIRKMEKEGVPEISLARLDGAPLQLSSLRGKIVIVNFWASWCNPCVEEFPSLIKLIEQFKDDVTVLAVSEDETKEDMTAFMKAMSLPKPGIEIVWDEKKEFMKTYGVEKIPETFLVGRDGKLIRKVLGIENWANEDAINYFKMLIAEGKPGSPPETLAKPGTGPDANAAAAADEAIDDDTSIVPKVSPTPEGAPTPSPTPKPKKLSAKKHKKKKHKKK